MGKLRDYFGSQETYQIRTKEALIPVYGQISYIIRNRKNIDGSKEKIGFVLTTISNMAITVTSLLGSSIPFGLEKLLK